MTPGPAQIIRCPFCGEIKKIMSLISGNTFGAEYWSDGKLIAPMLPEVSYVQKCPNCGKYYIISRQEEIYGEENDMSFDTGYLSYPEMKEAYRQLIEEGCDVKEERTIRFLLHYSYNDYYSRNEVQMDATSDDIALFRENALWLIENAISDDMLKADFYREIGDFNKALLLLNNMTFEDEFRNDIASKIRKNIDKEETKVFRIQ